MQLLDQVAFKHTFLENAIVSTIGLPLSSFHDSYLKLLILEHSFFERRMAPVPPELKKHSTNRQKQEEPGTQNKRSEC